MPEGPEIRLAADKIRRAVANDTLEHVSFGQPHLQQYDDILTGDTITDVTSRGKAMLTSFESGWVIYSHNQLYGRWYIKDAGVYPKTKRQLRLELTTANKSALLYSASSIELMLDHEVEDHPFLQKLGPDALNKNVTPKDVLDQLQSKAFQGRQLATSLLDQSFVAGLGNYLRSEILFVSQIHPSTRPKDLRDDALETLATNILDVTRRSYKTKGVTTSKEIVDEAKAKGLSRSKYRHWVFARSNQSCRVCGSKVIKETYGSRRLYLCPTCQPE